MGEPVYLDCNATTPVDARVAKLALHFMTEEFGNAGSRTHEFGARAAAAVQRARAQVAAVVHAQPNEVVFTSGATEADNLALLGAARAAARLGQGRHIVSTQIEHKAVLEPLQQLTSEGFEITLVPPTPGGWVDPSAIAAVLRPNTILVSVMHVNNETGVIQPLREIGALLQDHPALFHSDAAQGFGKERTELSTERLDLIAVSGHKVFAPKGIGALIMRRRNGRRPSLAPLMFGGGQEGGLRPGTVPVALAAALGLAAQLAEEELPRRENACLRFRNRLAPVLAELGFVSNGDASRTLPHVLNVRLPRVDSEALMLALKEVAAISNGAACASHSYRSSHVLQAQGLSSSDIASSVRISWCHDSDDIDVEALRRAVRTLVA